MKPLSGADVERTFLAYKSELGKELTDFWNGLTFLREEDDKVRMLTGKIHIGFDSDEASEGADSVFKLKTGGSLSRGTYPAELNFSSDVSLTVTGTQLQEDVSKFATSYEYHVTNFAEVYAFVERFSDSFLDIQQRYETGVGGMIGWNLHKTKQFRRNDHKLNDVANSAEVKAAVDKAVHKVSASGDAPNEPFYCALVDRVQDVRNALLRKQTTWFLGVAFSVFSELERAKISGWLRPQSAETSAAPQDLELNAEHRFRWTIRPTIIVRPNPDFVIKVYPYFKLPLDSPRKVNVDSTKKLDYRIDWLNDITWNVSKTDTGNEQVGFTFGVHHYFDNVPPRVPSDIVMRREVEGSTVLRTNARKQHTAVSLTMDIGWGK